MFDKDDIQHNLKTGADSDIMFTREITDKKSLDLNKLVLDDGIRKYPYLARTTGNSIKGMTEQITSNELRKGRTKSAPRQGNSSAEGSLDFELSPSTFDDNLEAVFRNEWKPWVSDTKSAINLDNTICTDGHFITRCIAADEKNYNLEENFGTRRLISNGEEGTNALIATPAGCVVHELTCGTKDIKYSVLKKLGGVEGEDLYQEFKHMAINSMNIDMQIGSIVTGSFDFMGNNNPKLLDEAHTRAEFGGTSPERFADGKTTGNDYMDNLPVKATTTDQFTTREGDLWINGKNITFAENLSFSINNGLEKKYALFVKNAISTQPLALDISGNLQTYVVAGESDELYNLGVDDATNEIVFALEDKEVDPEFIYVFQIFKTKFSDQDVSTSGADTMSQNHPYNSFEERAARVFRIALPKVTEIMFEPAAVWTEAGKVIIRPNVGVTKEDLTSLEVSIIYKDAQGAELTTKDIDTSDVTINDNGLIEVVEKDVLGAETATVRDVKVTLNATTITQAFGITEKEAPDPIKYLNLFTDNKKLVATWADPASPDFVEVEVDIKKGDKTILSKKVAKGVQRLDIDNLTNGAHYTVEVFAVDANNNKSTAESAEQTVGISKTAKTIAGLKYTDDTDSIYTFGKDKDEVARSVDMQYSAGTVKFEYLCSDEPTVCAIRSKDYADGKLIAYTYTGDDLTKAVTLNIVDNSLVTSMVPATINLKKYIPGP